MRAPATAARSEAHSASRPPAGARGSTGRAARPRGGIIFSHEKERGAAAHDRMGDGQSAVTVTRRGRAWDPLPHPHHLPTREGPRTGKSSGQARARTQKWSVIAWRRGGAGAGLLSRMRMFWN